MNSARADVTSRASQPPVGPTGHDVKATLEELWRERIDEISRLSVQLYAIRDADAADADAASSTAVEQAMVERRLNVARRAAADIEAALGRLDAGTYGVCERCEQPIAPARLDALPHAPLCAPCQTVTAHE